ncbi:MAG: YfhO family protein [Anaerolineae bacterium]
MSGNALDALDKRLGRHPRWRDIAFVALLWLVAAAFLGPALLPNKALVPFDLLSITRPWTGIGLPAAHNTLPSDVLFENYPNRVFFDASLRQGQLPLWDPNALGGRSLMGDPNAQPFYPLNYLLFWLPAARGMTIAVFINLGLAGSLMYAFLRVAGLGGLPAFLGAVTYMLNGALVVWLEYPPFAATSAWIPGALLGYELAVRRRRWFYAGLGGLALGLAFLGGQIEYPVLLGLIIGAYGILLALTSRRWQPVGMAVLLGAVGIGAAAVQILPAWEAIRLSERVLNDYGGLLATRVPFPSLVLLIAPDFFGNQVTGHYWGTSNYNEQTAYFAVAPLLLAVAAPFLRRNLTTLFWAGITILATLWITGTPVLRLAELVPGLGYFGLSRLVFIYPLSGAILAATALDALMQPQGRQRAGRIIAVAAALLALAYAAGLLYHLKDLQAQSPLPVGYYVGPALWLALATGAAFLAIHFPRAVVLIVVIAVADLFVFGARYNTVADTAWAYPTTDLITHLQADREKEVFRIATLQAEQLVFGPNIPNALGLAELGGYTSIPPARMRRLWSRAETFVPIPWINDNTLIQQFGQVRARLMGMLNVKYFVVPGDPSLPEFNLANRCDADTGEIYGGRRVGQTFTAYQNGLHRIDVRFQTYGRANAGKVGLHLTDGPTSDNHLAYKEIDAAAIQDGVPVTLFFDKITDSENRQYYFYVDAPNSEPGSAVGVCLANTWLPHKGQRFDNGQVVEDAGSLALGVYSLPTNLLKRRGTWDDVRVYHNPAYLPRAYVVYNVQPVGSEDEARETVLNPAFDPSTSAILDGPLPDTIAALAQNPPAPYTEVENIEHTPQRVTIETQTEQPGLLVLSDQYWPGWQATVDGQPTPIVHTNYVVRGVYLPAGKHQVVFAFYPSSFYLGLGITLATIAFVMAMIVFRVRRRERTT